jgi:uncharacterized protein YdhG (YjbR/CyaY superfamily)
VSEIDVYLAKVSGDKRAGLDKLRKTIRSIVPKAEECISYGMPAFRLDGAVIAGFQATARGAPTTRSVGRRSELSPPVSAATK